MGPQEIRHQFLKGNMRLVSDVWYPIIDVVPQDYLLSENNKWAPRLLNATCTVLAWILTHFFRIEGAKEMPRFELGQCPVDAGLITASICKSDLGLALPNDFPPLNKPTSWKQQKCASSPYGELKGLKIARDTAATFMEDDIKIEMSDPESGVALPRPTVDMREIFNLDNIFAQTEWVMSAMKARSVAVRNLEADARKAAVALAEKCNMAAELITRHMQILSGPTDNMQRKMLTERFIIEAKTMFSDALQKESKIGSAEVLGGFAAWMGLMQKEGYFMNAVSSYTDSAFGGFTGHGNTGHQFMGVGNQHYVAPVGVYGQQQVQLQQYQQQGHQPQYTSQGTAPPQQYQAPGAQQRYQAPPPVPQNPQYAPQQYPAPPEGQQYPQQQYQASPTGQQYPQQQYQAPPPVHHQQYAASAPQGQYASGPSVGQYAALGPMPSPMQQPQQEPKSPVVHHQYQQQVAQTLYQESPEQPP